MHNWLIVAIGKTVRGRRISQKLSLKRLAELTSLSVKTLGRIERGAVDMDICAIAALSVALETTPQAIINEACARDSERVLLVGASLRIAA